MVAPAIGRVGATPVPQIPDTSEADAKRIARANDGSNLLSKSATRSLDIVELLAEAGQPIRAKDICRRFNLGPSTAHQILKSMVRERYLSFDPVTKRYAATIRLHQMAEAIVRSPSFDGIASCLDRISLLTHGVVTLAERCDDFMRISDCRDAYSHHPVPIGFSYPFDTPSGTAYLASRTAEEADRIVERAVLHRALDKAAIPRLSEEIRRARELGYATGYKLNSSLRSVSIPTSFAMAGWSDFILSVTCEPDVMLAKLTSIVTIVRDTMSEVVNRSDRAAH